MLPKDIRKEILKMALAMLLVCTVMVAVFYLAGHGGLSVWYGALLGAAVATLNYLLLAFTVAFACRNSGKAIGGGVMGFSYIFRILLIGAAVIFAIRNTHINYIAAIIPLIFPRFIVTLFGVLEKKKTKKAESESSGGIADKNILSETEETDGTDGR